MSRIVGNEALMEKLKKAVETEEVSHAYIFEGPRGIGKYTVSREFAKMILCHSANPPCGTCQSCAKLKTDNHPDLFVIRPEKKKNSLKTYYSVSDIERMQTEMRRKPNESKKKVFIITEGEKLSVDSQNKFLKTLEEPLDNIVTIILTANANALLKTTTSRCQTLQIQPVSNKDLKNFILETVGKVENLESLLSFASGNIGKALELLKDESFQIRREKLTDVLCEIMEKDITKVFGALKYFEDEKEHVGELLDIILSWFRDILILKKTESEDYLINTEKLYLLKTHTQMLSAPQIYDIVNRVETVRRDLEQNVNYQLTIELMLLTIHEKSNISSSFRA